jgi:hypothetical protein
MDIPAGLGILYTNADAAEHVSLPATGGSTNLNVQTGVRSYSSTRGMSFACDAL